MNKNSKTVGSSVGMAGQDLCVQMTRMRRGAQIPVEFWKEDEDEIVQMCECNQLHLAVFPDFGLGDDMREVLAHSSDPDERAMAEEALATLCAS